MMNLIMIFTSRFQLIITLKNDSFVRKQMEKKDSFNLYNLQEENLIGIKTLVTIESE